MALTELARFLPRGTHHNRYLRSGMRPHHRDDHGMGYDTVPAQISNEPIMTGFDEPTKADD
jgi:putative (di)nucleoside polyphosphate hydrolase